MWRLVLVLSMLLTLAFSAVAEASPPPIVIESVTVERDGAGTTMRFTARSTDGAVFPETGTAVVMQVDGNRSKCLNVSLLRTGTSGGLATYVGKFNFTYSGASLLTGRVDIGGAIHDFSAPLDGKPGTIGVSADQRSINAASAPTVITPQPVVITPDPATIDPRTAAEQRAAVAAAQQAAARPEPLAAPASAIAGVASQPAAWLGLIVIVSALAGAYFDRKRALARATVAS
jgi:hypothetical protein